MTTYGTISTQAQASSSLSLLGRATEQVLSSLGSRRPWLELIQCSAFSPPASFSAATDRIKSNILFFRVNYAIVIFIALFISLLWQPFDLIIFLVLVTVWLFLYFLDDEALVVFGRAIDTFAVKVILLVLTACMFMLTHVVRGTVIGFLACSPVVLVHSVCRNKETLFVMEDDEEVINNTGATSLSSFS